MNLNDRPMCIYDGCIKRAEYRFTHSMDCVLLFCNKHANGLQNEFNKMLDLVSRGVIDSYAIECQECGWNFEIESMSVRAI